MTATTDRPHSFVYHEPAVTNLRADPRGEGRREVGPMLWTPRLLAARKTVDSTWDFCGLSFPARARRAERHMRGERREGGGRVRGRPAAHAGGAGPVTALWPSVARRGATKGRDERPERSGGGVATGSPVRLRAR